LAEETTLTAGDGSAAPAPLAPTPAPAPAAVPGPAAPKPPGPVRRTFDWFWRGRALKQLRAERRQESPTTRELTDRARLLFTLGERARLPAEPLPTSGDAAAIELYRQALYYAVRALSHGRGASTLTPWDALEPKLLASAFGSVDRGAEVSAQVEGGSFLDAWALSREERALRAAELAGGARFLLGELAWPTRARDALWLQRILRIGAVFALIAAVIFGVRFFSDRSERSHDLAVGKPWRISSSAGLGCSSPQQQCGDNTDFFFHTTEERNPWIELDLGRPTGIGAVRVVNRRDCCFERAIPLVVEVSNDQEHFREVARRTNGFSSWRADFPRTTARYVRVRVVGRTVMHLAELRVLDQ
jgi:hypothetical protein